ncbi:Ribose import ATP-binding protein RbsA [Stieleria bergensis]|uniref:Ribose import ATP-binding protein RbsA n=1 Tax=Stieleria bergensis TaxID=2528025 RepID=A0A517SZX4_9BACT|nr:Ribose import ATP-binding protein RbsA [Planctomycetes bacterium SV_7m_r]
MSQPTRFRARGLTKRYGKIEVLHGIDLEVGAGEIHALLGANGAGKSTLVKIIAGLIRPDLGLMELADQAYAPNGKQQSESAGVQIVQQELSLIPNLSIAENIFFTKLPSRFGWVRYRTLHRDAAIALKRFGLHDLDPRTPTSTLGVGQQQMIEIAAALNQDCRLLILDEPTAALTATETDHLFTWLGELRQQGVSMIYISHRLEEISRLADRISVMRDGRMIGTYQASELTKQQTIDLISGTPEEASADKPAFEQADPQTASVKPFTSYAQANPLMSVEGLCGSKIQDVHLTLHRGERLGIAGLVGSGRTELLRAIFGADRCTNGSITVGKVRRQLGFQHPKQAVDAGIAMITEDRKHDGLLLSQSVQSNLSLASLKHRFSRFGLIKRQHERLSGSQIQQQLQIKSAGLEQSVNTLSGGNQQKVVVGKWITHQPEIYLFDEPTRGIDVGVRNRLYDLFESLAQQGRGLVIVSSDLQELMETCDRIAVMNAGRLMSVFTRGQWSEEQLLQASFDASASSDETAVEGQA